MATTTPQNHELVKIYREVLQRLGDLESEIEALRLQADHSRTTLPGSWPVKLRLLKAIYRHGGHVQNAIASIGMAHTTAYYQKSSSRLFGDAWRYVVAYAKRHDDRPTWREFWPSGLADPAIEAAAGVTNLIRRLHKAGVIRSCSSFDETDQEETVP